MIDKTRFKKVFGAALEAAGFRRHAGGWQLSGSEAVVRVDAQKSNYDNLFFINISVRMIDLGPDKAENEHEEWHVRCRMERMLGLDAATLEVLTIDSTNRAPKEHEASLTEFMSLERISKFVELGTLRGLQSAYDRGELNGCLVHRRLKERLSRT